MAKTRIGSNAIFTGLQKGLTTIGQHAYAYNNADGDDNEFEVLSFTTGKEYMTATWRVGYASGTYRNYDFKLEFNGNQVEQLYLITSASNSNQQFQHDLIIPPLTSVRVLAANTEDSTTQSVNAIVIGKIQA
jgi:hypothetical protein